MDKLWNDLESTLEIELEYLKKLKENVLKEQSLIIMNQTMHLKGVLENQKSIMQKNFQIEKYRMQILNRLAGSQLIPNSQMNLKQIIDHTPTDLKLKFKTLYQKMKVVSFELKELNARNQMLLNNAMTLIDKDLKLIVNDSQKGVYHKNGELGDKQRISLLNHEA